MIDLNSRTIQGQARLAGAALVCIVLVLFIAATILGVSSIRALNGLSASISRTDEFVVPLQRAVLDVRFDAVQVQQFLSDVSTTRAQDGLDDGFKNAEEYARKFMIDIDTAINLARKNDRTDMVKSLSEAKEIFPPFYAQGRKMA